jgi:hypothetical protein
MVLRNGGLSGRRDAFLLLIGAFFMHLCSLLFSQQTILIDAYQSPVDHSRHHTVTSTEIRTRHYTVTETTTAAAVATETPSVSYDTLPDTFILAHAPGWSLFRNLYMSNGTLFVVASESDRSKFPEIRMMASHPLVAYNNPENIAAREPSDFDMTFITPEEAKTRWGNRILPVEGNTVSTYYSLEYIIDLYDYLFFLILYLDIIQRPWTILTTLLSLRGRVILWYSSILAWLLLRASTRQRLSLYLYSSLTASNTPYHFRIHQCRWLARWSRV